MTEDAAEARFRAAAYRILSFGFHFPPRKEDVALMDDTALLAGRSGRVEISESLSRLASLARETPEESIVQDFNDLFMVPTNKYVAPYESVYRDAPIVDTKKSSPRTFGPSTQAVITFYEHIGLDISRDYIELPDYVGLEMACMEYLCDREAGFLEAHNEEAAAKVRAHQQAFLGNHLNLWIPQLAEKTRRKTETDYYRNLAALACAWIHQELAPPCPTA